MPTFDANWIKETTTTTGTGTITLAGAVTGYQAFIDGVGFGDVVYYLEDADGLAKEVGIGLVDGAGPYTITRANVKKSTNANAAINLSAGTHVVRISPVAGYMTGDIDCLGNKFIGQALSKDYREPSEAAISADCTLGNSFEFLLTASATLSIANPPSNDARSYEMNLFIIQDATGGRVLTLPGSFTAANGNTYTLNTAANAINFMKAITYNGGTSWIYWMP